MEECVTITNEDLTTMSPRCYKMIHWIYENQKDIDWQFDGSITFSYSQGNLKVEYKKYKRL